ncbi:CaiB/BaiF CoA-transferase family protein [Sphingomonas sp. CL5.1]|uniref:CaiB/BaiF CoA transferase family protein n=1 Tax=Sphingomonas sp. CL5.1 TaxID=2653203 RepID=UPI001C2F03D3|nr:CoA transferase [Sphingomonas sp. CL5.1]
MAGVRIIDLTTIVMAASASQMLADLGADVIKVEGPEGDPIRRVGPFGDIGMGPMFLSSNRNKRSVVLDLKNAAGVSAFKRLLVGADVLVCNVRPAGMRRLGLTFEVMQAINPRLIYANLIGFSQRGRYGPSPAFDDLIQAATGIPSLIAEHNDDGPRYVPMNVMDRAVGLYAFGVIASALYARERTGTGQQVDVPMFETMVPFVLGDHFWGQKYRPARGGFGYPRIMTKERQPYRTRDDFVCCTIYSDANWRAFLTIIGQPEKWTDDPKLGSIAARTANSSYTSGLVRDEMAKRTTAEWCALLLEADIPVFPVHTMASLVNDPHLTDIGFFTDLEHPAIGRYVETAVPSEWHGTTLGPLRPAPLIGEHTVEVLREAGLSNAEIDQLDAPGAARQADNSHRFSETENETDKEGADD